jgi:hypothetical protein
VLIEYCGQLLSLVEVPVPLLCSRLVGWWSPAFDPGNVLAEGATEVDRGLVDGQSMDGGPQFQLVSVALAFVAVVPSGFEVDGERATAGRRRAVNGTGSMQLVSGLTGRHEAELVQYVFGADCGAQRLVVDGAACFTSVLSGILLRARNREEAPVLVFTGGPRQGPYGPFGCLDLLMARELE